MALSLFQRDVCRLLASSRVRSGESYVADGATLNELLDAPRVSRDLDIFHDTEEALSASWQTDRALLEGAGYQVQVFRDRQGLIEAEVRRDKAAVRMEWARDSAYRFFPLVEHPELGLALHPFDLATSKVLALVGRVELRDFVDTVTLSRRHGVPGRGARVRPAGVPPWQRQRRFAPAPIASGADGCISARA